MRLPNEETPGRNRDTGASDNSVATTDSAKPSRAGRGFSQTDRVLRFLNEQFDGAWGCDACSRSLDFLS